MDEKLSELCEKVDGITASQAYFESKMEKEFAGIKEQVQQVSQTQSQPPQTLGNAVKNNRSQAPWMRLNYLVNTKEVDTEILAEFCELLNTSLRKGIHIYSPLPWKSYAKGAKENWLKSFFYVDKYEMVFIPTVENIHFFSIHIHVIDHCIYIVDPMYFRLEDDHQAHLNLVVMYILTPYMVDVLIGSQKFLDDGWTSYFVKNNPKQDNAYECGVYMAKYLEYWGKNEKLPFDKLN
ncbi:hypothetical protein POM88_033060 [Heracleum sosnowskyi]|uniref:Ubiquitin-like protease family profile domain-containing protein n=1 Tax=Heracleum sosnowskyi TaxID=360622 RepID=A0AAD8I0I0_9APIA|nr:hypothetical protein POM88_033060 [Heracleum sosnowskyi]